MHRVGHFCGAVGPLPARETPWLWFECMTDRRNPDPGEHADDADDTPDHRTGGPQRWQHPSEVGLAVRGRSDRRRSAVIVAGLLLGGVGLLVSGVLLGSMDDAETDDVVADRIEHSVANVVVVQDGVGSTVTGLVLDHDGHLAVRAGALRGAEEIWARCADGQMESASVVAVDPDKDLAVLRLAAPAGRPAQVSEAVPRPGMDVLAVDAVPGAVNTVEATVTTSTSTTPSDRFHAELGSIDDGASLVFDRDGHLMGMSAAGQGAAVVEVRSAAAMMGAARRLLER